MTAAASASDEEEEPPRDEEGLLLHYDVILCGTGLVQAILASALARAGKSVLHCDGNDYYGEYDAVVSRAFDWNQQRQEEKPNSDESCFALRPRARIQLHSTDTLTHVPIEVGTELSTPYGIGVVVSLPQDNSGDTPTVVIQLKEWPLADGTYATLHVGIPSGSTAQEYLQLHMTPTRLVQAQQVLFHQQRYFAFDLTPSLLYASGPAVDALLTSGVAEYMEFKSLEGLLWCDGQYKLSRVPCSKGDVFGTSLLSPLEKRRLMKFLQLTLDYATAQETEGVAAETTASSLTSSTAQVQSLNEHHLNQGRSLARPQNKAIASIDLQLLDDSLDMPFCDYLSQHAKLSSNLVQLVQHALALEPGTSLTTKKGMLQLCQHVQALGRYGTTAFLVPLYGSGELSQSFCRSAAVHGATYLLRRSPKRIQVEENAVRGVVLSSSEGEKLIPCETVVVAAHALSNNTKRRFWRRISIVQGRLLEDYDQQRHVLIVPPGLVDNPYAIHGLVVDQSVHVTPPGCTILHLTTTTDDTVNGNDILESFVQKLKVDEIHHVAFSYPLPDKEEEMGKNVDGLYVCQTLGQSLTLDAQVAHAKSMFQSICPNVDFLTMSQEIDKIVKERLAGRDEEDEERMVLESAMNMVEADTETNPAATNDNDS